MAWSSSIAKPLSMRSSACLLSVSSTRYSPFESCWSTVIWSGPISAEIASLMSFREQFTGVRKITERPFRSAMLATAWTPDKSLSDLDTW